MLYSASTNGFYSNSIHATIPFDAVEVTNEEYTDLMNGQSLGRLIVPDAMGRPALADPPAPPPPTAEQMLASFTAAIQKRLDDFARTRGYDGILSACTYATSAVPKFAAEGRYAVDARDATWSAAYAILAEVQAGDRPIPGSLSEIESDLPVLAWPEA